MVFWEYSNGKLPYKDGCIIAAQRYIPKTAI